MGIGDRYDCGLGSIQVVGFVAIHGFKWSHVMIYRTVFL